MKKIYVGFVLALVFVGTLAVLYSLNIETVVATSSSTAPSWCPEYQECVDNYRFQQIWDNRYERCLCGPINWCTDSGLLCDEILPGGTACVACLGAGDCPSDYCNGDVIVIGYGCVYGTCIASVKQVCTGEQFCYIEAGEGYCAG